MQAIITTTVCESDLSVKKNNKGLLLRRESLCAQDRTRTAKQSRGYQLAQTIGRAINPFHPRNLHPVSSAIPSIQYIRITCKASVGRSVCNRVYSVLQTERPTLVCLQTYPYVIKKKASSFAEKAFVPRIGLEPTCR